MNERENVTAAPGAGKHDGDNSSVEELKRQNTSLEEENRRLHQIAQYRSAFLSRLAHELRTPLTSILGFAEILLNQEEITEAQRNFCERIQNSAQQLQDSLSQLADLSRLEAGRSELQREEFSLADLFRESCAAVARQAEKQNVEVRFETPPGLPPIVSDRAKLRQVIYNFLAYAISRSPEGALVAGAVERDRRGFLIKIEDEDEQLADTNVIEDVDSRDRRSAGSELGLAIARQYVDLLGGAVNFHNRQPRGVQILIQLPATLPTEPSR